MKQEVGETRDAIIDDTFKDLEKIIQANKARRTPYWIVLYAKRTGEWHFGRPVIRQHVKAYGIKPKPMVGMITFEINNETGEIKPDVNLHDVPFDWNRMTEFGAKRCDELVTETKSIANAYITN